MKIGGPSPTHEQLVGVELAQHHTPPFAIGFDLGGDAYEIPGWHHYATANGLVVADELYVWLIYCARETSYTRIACRVGVGGAGGTVGRLGLYDAELDGDGQLGPGALQDDSGTVSVASTGAKEIVIAETLTQGYHYVAFSSDGAPQLVGANFVVAAQVPFTPVSPGMIGALALGHRVTVADGAAALPDPCPAMTDPEATVIAPIRLRR
tara:strand:- start:311 stop:937 length:627 start_codon:yes stop_codon:yes gene_type:complete